MERDYQTPPKPPKNNKSANIVGAAIVFFGLMLLLRNLDQVYFPRWIFGWEMILIIIGIVIGLNSKFEKRSSVILITIGGLFLLKNMFDLSFGGVIVPVGVIIIGVYLIMKNRKANVPPTLPPPYKQTPSSEDEFDWDKRVEVNEIEKGDPTAHQTHDGQQSSREGYTFEGENYIKVDTIFGDAKKRIFSKNFLGGSVTNMFGSTQINLIQADIQQPVALDVFQLFGSTKIIVPPHWVVATTVSSILSENDDRRVILTNAQDHNKHIYITGTSIFGSITIKNS